MSVSRKRLFQLLYPHLRQSQKPPRLRAVQNFGITRTPARPNKLLEPLGPSRETSMTRECRTPLALILFSTIVVVLPIFAQRAIAEPSAARTPIQHLIVVIGENRGFDHIFGLYKPRSSQSISNLLSRGIVNQDGSPGPNFGAAAQFQVSPQPSYFISAPNGSKTPFATLPPPDLSGVPQFASDTDPPPFATIAAAAFAEPSLEPQDTFLLTTGATGLLTGVGPDTRIFNVTNLPNGPYQQTALDPATGNGLAYDSYTEDTVHRFFQMWQQSDCGTVHASPANPTGCLSDLLPFVTTTSLAPLVEGMGTPMAFFNVNAGDAPYLKKLADQFTLSDNYHQAVMGGTYANHIMLGTGDMLFFSDGAGNAVVPPPIPGQVLGLPTPLPLIANPNPVPGSNNRYAYDLLGLLGIYVKCADNTQPGVAAITRYLQSLPYHASANCEPDHYYAVNIIFPGFHPDGTPANPANPNPAPDGSDLVFVPPSTVKTIGDALIEKNVSWRYYGGGFDAAVDGEPNAYCPNCNPMQFATSIMANPAVRQEHNKDIVDFFADVAGNNLPAVSFVKPSGFVDGHPATSKLDLFEAFLKSIIDKVQAKPSLFAHSAILVTFDETGGFYDSGFIQPLDFFGDGPRVPMIAISPFSKGGQVVHTYYDHASILKFIERNWGLQPLTARSRDNLPNPVQDASNPYVPKNMPAIGDLMEMFHFASPS
jgi:phospholipase C